MRLFDGGVMFWVEGKIFHHILVLSLKGQKVMARKMPAVTVHRLTGVPESCLHGGTLPKEFKTTTTTRDRIRIQ
jgi:hypothetical protein